MAAGASAPGRERFGSKPLRSRLRASPNWGRPPRPIAGVASTWRAEGERRPRKCFLYALEGVFTTPVVSPDGRCPLEGASADRLRRCLWHHQHRRHTRRDERRVHLLVVARQPLSRRRHQVAKRAIASGARILTIGGCIVRGRSDPLRQPVGVRCAVRDAGRQRQPHRQ